MSDNRELENVGQSDVAPRELTRDLVNAATAALGGEVNVEFDRLLELAKREDDAGRTKAAEGMKLSLRAGTYLLAARDDHKYGDWLPYLEKCGISKQRASELTRVAERYALAPPGARDAFLGLGVRQSNAIAQIPTETLAKITADEFRLLLQSKAADIRKWLNKRTSEMGDGDKQSGSARQVVADDIAKDALDAARQDVLVFQWRARAELEAMKQLCGPFFEASQADTTTRAHGLEIARLLIEGMAAISGEMAQLQQSLSATYGAALRQPNFGYSEDTQRAVRNVELANGCIAEVEGAANARASERPRPADDASIGRREKAVKIPRRRNERGRPKKGAE